MLHRILLLLSALFWGGTFVVVKQAVAAADPILFIGARFLLAAIMLVVIFPRVLRRNLRDALRPGITLGLMLTAGYITQTLGLQLTTATASGFITGLSIILVTVFDILITRKSPGIPGDLRVIRISKTVTRIIDNPVMNPEAVAVVSCRPSVWVM